MYDEHAGCRDEIRFWRDKLAEPTNVREVIRRVTDAMGMVSDVHHYEKLKVVQIDAFGDGLRILVE